MKIRKQHNILRLLLISFSMLACIHSIKGQNAVASVSSKLNNHIEYNPGCKSLTQAYQASKTEDTSCVTDPPVISVNFKGGVKIINKGQFGINISGLFTPTTLYEGEFSADQWQWLSDLQPNTLRFPSGSTSKFMHLLTGSKGYGYDIIEITRYLDAVDGELEAPDNAEDILGVTDTAIQLEWFDGSTDIWQAYQEYKQDFALQESLEPGDLYIDQFIRLIKKIEDEHPGHHVDVIVCLNIISESAENCKAIVDYLESNPIHNVNVVGVEMGNEPTSKFYQKILLFEDFNDYWDYLDGKPLAAQEQLEDDLGEQIFLPTSDHHFFDVFKNKGGFDCKIGLAGGRLQDTTEIQQQGGTRADDSWNTDLVLHYEDVHDGSNIQKFHAIVFHTYYEKDDWYNETVEPFLENNYYCPDWEFETADNRLLPAFEAARKNFRNYTTSEYKKDFDALNAIYQFDLSSRFKKELWVTEWNLKDEGTDNKGKIFTNTFLHSVLVQEWWMRSIKMNFEDGYRENFLTYSTIQNYAGGAQVQLLTPADEDVELELLGKNYPPYNLSEDDTAKRNYFVKRTTMFTVELISEIYKNKLLYLPSTSSAYTHNANISPTCFVDPDLNYLYLFYSNPHCGQQQFIVDPEGLFSLSYFPVLLEGAIIHAIDAQQIYSTSGKSMIYDINSCFDPFLNPYTIEISDSIMIPNPGCDATEGKLCVSVPGYTAGFVKIQISPDPHKQSGISQMSELQIFPNPATDFISIQNNDEVTGYLIQSMPGDVVQRGNIAVEPIDISHLPAGIYWLVLQLANGNRLIERFVKTG